MGIAQGGVQGGVFFNLNASLVNPEGGDQLRLSEIEQVLGSGGNPLSLFDITGDLFFKLYAFVDVHFLFINYDWSQNIVPPITLLSFSQTPPPRPILASENAQGVLTLNMGPNASKRLGGNTSDGDESFTVVQNSDGSITVEDASVNGQPSGTHYANRQP